MALESDMRDAFVCASVNFLSNYRLRIYYCAAAVISCTAFHSRLWRHIISR